MRKHKSWYSVPWIAVTPLLPAKGTSFFQSWMEQAITSGTSAVLIAEGKLTVIPTPRIFRVSETEKPNEP